MDFAVAMVVRGKQDGGGCFSLFRFRFELVANQHLAIYSVQHSFSRDASEKIQLFENKNSIPIISVIKMRRRSKPNLI